jgi:hypothetical protein
MMAAATARDNCLLPQESGGFYRLDAFSKLAYY